MTHFAKVRSDVRVMSSSRTLAKYISLPHRRTLATHTHIYTLYIVFLLVRSGVVMHYFCVVVILLGGETTRIRVQPLA